MTQLTYQAAFLSTKAINKSKRSIDVIASSAVVDSMGDVIDQKSWNLTRFLANPIILRGHDQSLVVGRGEDVHVVGDQLLVTICFASTPLAQETYQLYLDGALKGVSVGFRPGRIAQEIIGGKAVRKLFDCELFELSCVSIPANPEALLRHKSLGLVPEHYTLTASEELVQLANKAIDGALLVAPEPGQSASEYLARLAEFHADGGV